MYVCMYVYIYIYIYIYTHNITNHPQELAQHGEAMELEGSMQLEIGAPNARVIQDEPLARCPKYDDKCVPSFFCPRGREASEVVVRMALGLYFQ